MQPTEISELRGNWRMRAYLKPAAVAAEEKTVAPQMGNDPRYDMLFASFGDLQEDSTLPPNVYHKERVTQIISKAVTLFSVKNVQYGNAISRTGVIGAVTALTGDVARLRQMVLREPEHGRQDVDNVEDKLLDILVQAAIGILMVQEDNWLGED